MEYNKVWVHTLFPSMTKMYGYNRSVGPHFISWIFPSTTKIYGYNRCVSLLKQADVTCYRI